MIALAYTIFFKEAALIWSNGGWLMIPLFLLAVFIYYTAIELLINLSNNFFTRKQLGKMNDQAIEALSKSNATTSRSFFLQKLVSVKSIQNHFQELRNEYLPVINRRIKFLAVIITTGPLMGLLGTVTGMLTTFNGIEHSEGDKLSRIIGGISEALITTQTGLIISIPALFLLSIITQKRNTLERNITRLESFHLQKLASTTVYAN